MWPAFPKRLQSALKALCSLAGSGREMQSPEVARQIDVTAAETAKILQLLVWGGFVASRRGSKGGFRLAAPATEITLGQVIDFFQARHSVEPEGNSAVMRVLQASLSPCQKSFGELTVADVVGQPRAVATKRPRGAGVSRKQSANKKLIAGRRST